MIGRLTPIPARQRYCPALLPRSRRFRRQFLIVWIALTAGVAAASLLFAAS